MTNRIYEDIAKEGAIVPVPLILLAVAISFPFVIAGCLIERTAKWILSWKDKKTWV